MGPESGEVSTIKPSGGNLEYYVKRGINRKEEAFVYKMDFNGGVPCAQGESATYAQVPAEIAVGKDDDLF